MCAPLYIDPSIQVTRSTGSILPGETPIEAAVRRHRESKSLEETEWKNSSPSDKLLEGYDSTKENTVEEVQEKTPMISEFEAPTAETKRRLSWGDRWRSFKRHYLP